MTRHIHRRLAILLVLFLAVAALTGVSYRIGRAWFGLDRATGDLILAVHTGEWISPAFAPFYVLFVGGGLLVLLASGAWLLLKSRGADGTRRVHRILGAILLLPLAATAVTGIAYEVGERWFGLSEETADVLMTIHEGAWLGRTAKPFYVLLVGGGLLLLALSGLRLLLRVRRKKAGR